MEPQKRKYQKHKTEKQITVTHFVNSRLKGKKRDDGQIAYPLYIRITVKNQHTDIKSRIGKFVVPDEFEWVKQEYSALLNQEINSLTNIIKSLNPFDRKEFTLQQAIAIYGQSIKPLTTIIDDSLKDEIRYCIVKNDPDLPADTNTNNKGELIALAQENDLIQLINWQQPASVILVRLKAVVSNSDLSAALTELEFTHRRAFNFDGIYNTLNAIHSYIVPQSLIDWQEGKVQTDIESYFTDSGPTIESINHLLKSHF